MHSQCIHIAFSTGGACFFHKSTPRIPIYFYKLTQVLKGTSNVGMMAAEYVMVSVTLHYLSHH